MVQSTASHIQVEGKCGPGRPKMTWKQLTERDCREWKLSAINPQYRNMWRSGVRVGMRAASQLSGRGGLLMWMLPLFLHVNQKSRYDLNSLERDVQHQIIIISVLEFCLLIRSDRTFIHHF